MSDYLSKLLSHSTPSLTRESLTIGSFPTYGNDEQVENLIALLKERNGFYSLESALHVFPSHSSTSEFGLDEWNHEFLWRKEYGDVVQNCLFFAEDIFGGQFCIRGNKIFTFDPETGLFEYLADNIFDWAQLIINDYNVLTGYPLAHQWQEFNGSIPPKKRLLPKTPFVLGGEFAIDNLYLCDSVEGMRSRANLANQIKDLPDGEQIQFDIID